MQSLMPATVSWLQDDPAIVAAGGCWMYDQDWNWVFLPVSSVCLSGSMGLGMEYWLTRDDTPEAESPHRIFAAAPATYPFWIATGVFPAAPPHWQPVTFRIPMNGPLERFTVHQSDGATRPLELVGND